MELTLVTTAQAVEGMRAHFMKSFGRTWVGRRLAHAAWPTFRAGLLHGLGIAVSADLARLAAEERNLTTVLVARWPNSRIRRVVDAAVAAAANAV